MWLKLTQVQSVIQPNHQSVIQNATNIQSVAISKGNVILVSKPNSVIQTAQGSLQTLQVRSDIILLCNRSYLACWFWENCCILAGWRDRKRWKLLGRRIAEEETRSARSCLSHETTVLQKNSQWLGCQWDRGWEYHTFSLSFRRCVAYITVVVCCKELGSIK